MQTKSASGKNGFLSLTRRARFCSILLLGVIGNGAAQTTEPIKSDAGETASATPELMRVQNLMRANVLGLAQEILETRAPALKPDGNLNKPPTAQWLQWERQLWTLYRVRRQWQKLYERTRQLPPAFPKTIHHEAQLLAITALTALQRGSAARNFIKTQLLTNPPPQHQRRLRQALISAYLADDLLIDARIAMAYFRKDFGAGESDWLLLSAGVLLRSGDPAAAINLLAPLTQPAARLLRLYARLGNQSLTPDQVIKRATKFRATNGALSLGREIQALMAEAHIKAGQFYSLADVLEDYLLTPPGDFNLHAVYPQFDRDDLFDVYVQIAEDQANQAGLLIGEELLWLDHAQLLPPTATVARKSLFVYLALTTQNPALHQRAVDGYVDVLINIKRTKLLEHLFGPDTRLGELSLGDETGVRLSLDAMNAGNFRLAAEINANLSALPAGVERIGWLLQAGRIDILAGRHQQGAAKLDEWIESFNALRPAQVDAILQPIFDLQTVEQHSLALALLHKVEARAPAGKHRREIAYWLAESYHGSEQYITAADLFLHSALQQADGFDRWGEAARFRAAEALMDGKLFDDARQLFEDMLARAQSETSRSTLKQRLQQLSLLQSSSQNSAAVENDW